MSLQKASKLMESLRSNERCKTQEVHLKDGDGSILEIFKVDFPTTEVSGQVFLESLLMEEEEDTELNVAEIDYIIFNNPATIVVFTDGTKEVAKVTDGDKYQPEIGVAMALMKKLFGSRSQYKKYLKQFMPELKVGDLVHLKGQSSLKMCINQILTHDMVECIWFKEDNTGPFLENFHVDQLVVTK